jgi:hypothetical protein
MTPHWYEHGQCVFCHKTKEQNRDDHCITREQIESGDQSKSRGQTVMSSTISVRDLLIHMTLNGMTYSEIPYGEVTAVVNLVLTKRVADFRDVCRKFAENK